MWLCRSGDRRGRTSPARRFIPDGSKGAYNLRKEFGSAIVERNGIETAAKLLRDSIAVVEAHYFGLLDRPKPL
jgi:hypothetical protein